MRNFVFFILLLLPIVASAQFPANPRKMRLGYQTTADGLIYRASGAPNFTPADSDDARVYIDTETGDLYVYNSGWIKTARKTDAITRVDTVNQINHGFSVGDPLWKSGDYVLARDTGLSVTVSGIVIDSFDANTFYVQRNGVFTLTGHGFTVDQQLYVQPDGSYSAADTANHLIYGFALDANTIQIGAKPANSVSFQTLQNSINWSATTKYRQNDILNFSGNQYRLTTTSSTGERPDTSTNWIIVTTANATSERFLSIIDNSITADSIQSLLSVNKLTINSTITDTTTFDRVVNIPSRDSITAGKSLFVTSIRDGDSKYYIKAPTNEAFYIEQLKRYGNEYYLDNNEVVQVFYTDSTSVIKTIQNEKNISLTTGITQGVFIEGDKVFYNDGLYNIQKTEPSTGVDGIFSIAVTDKAPFGENLINRSQSLLTGSASDGRWVFGGGLVSGGINSQCQDLAIGPDGTKTADAIVRYSASGNAFRKHIDNDGTSIQFSSGEKVTVQFDLRRAEAVSNHNSYIDNIRIADGATPISIETYSASPTSTTDWDHFEFTFTMSSATTPGVAPRVLFAYNSDVGDTIYMTNVQVERTAKASKFKFTGEDENAWFTASDTLYAVLQPINGYIDLNRAYRPVTLTEDHTYLELALDYCASRSDCQWVVPVDESILADTVSMPPRVGINGLGYVNVNVNLGDITKNAIHCETEGITYAYQQRFRDITFTAQSAANSIIYGRNSADQLYENITIDGIDSINYCLVIGDPALGLRALATTIQECEFKNAIISNVYYQNCGNDHHYLRNVSIRGEGYGVSGDVSQLFIEGKNTETNTLGALSFSNSGIISVTNAYFENSDIFIDTTDQLVFTNSRLSGGDLQLTQVKTSKITGNRFFAGTTVIHDRYGEHNISSNWFQDGADFNIVRNQSNGYAGVNLARNTTEDNLQNLNYSQYSNLDGRTDQIESRILVGNSRRFSVDTIVANEQNLVYWSDSLNVGGALTSYSITPNYANNQNGNATADLFVGTNSIGSTGEVVFNKTISPALTVGETYTISQWIRDVKNTGRSTAELEYWDNRAGAYYPNEWTQLTYTFVAQSARAALEMKVRSVSVGDSILFGSLMVNKGAFPMMQTPTTNSSVNQGKTKTNIENRWVISGTVQLLDSLLDNSGSSGLINQTATSTGSGWQWAGPSYGEAYIDYVDPDTVTVVTAGTLYDFTDVSEGSSSSDVTVSTTTGRLTYTGTIEKLFAVTWSATVTSDAVNENLIGTVMDNGATITRIRWEEEDTASGDRHSVSASGFFSMGQNDWVQPKLTSQSNGTQIEVITMSFKIQEVR